MNEAFHLTVTLTDASNVATVAYLAEMIEHWIDEDYSYDPVLFSEAIDSILDCIGSILILTDDWRNHSDKVDNTMRGNIRLLNRLENIIKTGQAEFAARSKEVE